MELPGVQDLLLPLLNIMADQREYRISEMVDRLADHIIMETNPSLPSQSLTRGNKAIFYSHVVGARSYLAHAGLIENPRREVSRITPRGIMLLAEQPANIDLLTLAQYPEFIEYMQNEKSAHSDPLLIKLAESLGQTEAQKRETEQETLLSSVSNLLREMEEEVEEDQPLADPSPFSTDSSGNGHQNHTIIGASVMPPVAPQDATNDMINTPLDKADTGPLHEPVTPPLYRERDPHPSETQPLTRISRSGRYDNKPRREIIEAEEKVNPLAAALLVTARYIENFYTHKWSYLLIILLTTIGYIASYFLIEDKFASQGIIYVQSDTILEVVTEDSISDFNIYISPAEQTADELKEFINTNSFLRVIISQTALEATMDDGIVAVNETIEDVYDAIAVDWTGTNNVVVKATWEDRAIAMDLANATLNSFIDWKISADIRDSGLAVEFLEGIVPQYEQEYQIAVENLEAYLIQNPEPNRGDRKEIEQIQIAQLQNEVNNANERLKTNQDRLEAVRLEQVIVEGKTRQTYQIVDSPLGNTPIEPVGGWTQEAINFAIFTTVGLAIMFLAVGVSTLLDQSIKFPKEVTTQLNETILTQVAVEEKPRPSRRRGK